MTKVKRIFCPSPWHDALSLQYTLTERHAPSCLPALAAYHRMTVERLRLIHHWTIAATRVHDCPGEA